MVQQQAGKKDQDDAEKRARLAKEQVTGASPSPSSSPSSHPFLSSSSQPSTSPPSRFQAANQVAYETLLPTVRLWEEGRDPRGDASKVKRFGRRPELRLLVMDPEDIRTKVTAYQWTQYVGCVGIVVQLPPRTALLSGSLLQWPCRLLHRERERERERARR